MRTALYKTLLDTGLSADDVAALAQQVMNVVRRARA